MDHYAIPLMNNYTYQDRTLVRGEGACVWDDAGRAYLDFMAGVGSLSLGHAAPAVLKALRDQAPRLMAVSGAFHTGPRTDLARFLVDHSFADRVCFANSGTEAVEAALKLARAWAYAEKGPESHTFLAFTNAYHGRSYGAVSVTEKSQKHPFFAPYLPGVRFAPFNNLAGTEAMIGPDVAAIIVEPLQGDGGLIAAEAEFLRGLRHLADRHDIALIFDEVQCGSGRLGTLFAYETFGVEPDMVTMSKAMGGGYPIGALLARERFARHFTPGTHGSTLAGAPLACAVSLAVLEAMAAPGLLKNVRDRGAQLHAGLSALVERHPARALSARGMGLMQGIEVCGDANALRRALMEAGLMATTAGESVIRLLPPLTVTQAEVDEALGILDGVLGAAGTQT
ncbi:MAG TPA: hypothetical protein DDX54_01400 [Rhodospirillaceae bacterium]|jgi:acetylornithine/N-succinyldiaminopimelate aminotransferase|nr:acetylornithine transaminase [Alphaproteobacteria bacterium]HBH26049.1 hypothetical protein [Rhodospirillaceae bacterium]